MLHLLLLQGIPEAPPLNPITRWEWVFPFVEDFHICGFTLLVGTILILNFRILGIWLRNYTIPNLAKELWPWIYAGMAVQLITGPYLLSSDAREYWEVPAMRHKMVFLAIALVFQLTVMQKATSRSTDSASPGWRKPAAVVSMGLWMCVLLAGMWIGNL